MLKKFLEYSLYLIVFLLPVQTRWIILSGELSGGYFEYGTISLYGVDIIIFLMMSFVIGDFFLKRFKEPDIHDYWWVLAVLEFSVFISIIFSLDKTIALYGYIKFLLGIGLFYLILNLYYDKIKLIYFFLAGVFGQAVLSIWQFLHQTSFASKWLGLAVHNASVLGSSVVETSNGERWLRAYGGLDHPNILGGFLVVGIFLIIYLWFENKNKCSKLFSSIFFYLSILIFLLALFFTFSRGAWLSFGVGLVVMFSISVFKKDLLVQQKLLKIILASGIFIFILINIFGNLVSTRLAASSRLELKSSTERIESYQAAVEVIKENWFFGVGIGNYPLAIEKNVISGEPSYFYQPVHNVFLLVFAEIGFVGLLFFAVFLIFVFHYLLKNHKNKDDKNIYLISLIILLLVTFQIDHWWWSLHFGVLLFWFIAGILLQKKAPNT